MSQHWGLPRGLPIGEYHWYSPQSLIASKRDPENSPEYSEFLYLFGTHWEYNELCVPVKGYGS